MTETTEAHGIPDRVLERAAEAAGNRERDWWDTPMRDRSPDLWVSIIESALLILTPAIETALLERMIADFEEWIWVQADMPEDRWWEGSRTGIREAILIARTYLPTATQGADDHE